MEQDEQELVLELVFRVCARQRKKMGAGISGGGPPWDHEAGGAPYRGGRPPPLWPGGSSSRGNFCTVNPQIFLKKSY